MTFNWFEHPSVVALEVLKVSTTSSDPATSSTKVFESWLSKTMSGSKWIPTLIGTFKITTRKSLVSIIMVVNIEKCCLEALTNIVVMIHAIFAELRLLFIDDFSLSLSIILVVLVFLFTLNLMTVFMTLIRLLKFGMIAVLSVFIVLIVLLVKLLRIRYEQPFTRPRSSMMVQVVVKILLFLFEFAYVLDGSDRHQIKFLELVLLNYVSVSDGIALNTLSWVSSRLGSDFVKLFDFLLQSEVSPL